MYVLANKIDSLFFDVFDTNTMLHLLKKISWSDMDDQFIRNIYISITKIIFVQTDDMMIVFDHKTGKQIDEPFDFHNGMIIYKADMPASCILSNFATIKKTMRLLTI